jgi:hypothetical protein
VSSEDLNFPMLGMVQESLDELKVRGISTAEVEVGPLTFEFLIDLMIARREWRKVTPEMVRLQIKAGTIDLHFDGSTVVMADVPEGRCWPSRKVERETYA